MIIQTPPVGDGGAAGGGVVARGREGGDFGPGASSVVPDGEGIGEVPGNGAVPVMLVETGERARFQNELPDRGGGLRGGRRAEDGEPQAGVIGGGAAERQVGRSDAEHRNEGVGGERWARCAESRFRGCSRLTRVVRRCSFHRRWCQVRSWVQVQSEFSRVGDRSPRQKTGVGWIIDFD